MLTAILVVKNEQSTIARAISSCQFATEILVVDSYSTDNTVAIAQKLGARVLTRAWTGFSDQRNFALDQAAFDWVFSLDGDEAASPELANAIKKILTEHRPSDPVCYRIRREEYFLGKHLTGGPGNPSFQERLLSRKWVRYQGNIHEFPRILPGAPGGYGLIQEPIHHNPDFNTSRFLAKMNHYTSLEAQERHQQGRRTTMAHALGTFFSTFLKNLVSYRGYRNGWQGLILIFLESVSRSVRHFKILELQRIVTKEPRP